MDDGFRIFNPEIRRERNKETQELTQTETETSLLTIAFGDFDFDFSLFLSFLLCAKSETESGCFDSSEWRYGAMELETLNDRAICLTCHISWKCKSSMSLRQI